MVFLYTFYQMIIHYKHYTEITNILLQTFSIFPLFLLCRFFLISSLYQIYKEKSISLAAPVFEIVNQILFMSSKLPKEDHGYAKRIFRNLSSPLYFEKTKKNNKASISRKPEFEFQRCFTAKTKNGIAS